MSFFRNILHDLVEKRLWPLALLLCVALVAVPVFLKKDPEVATSAPSGPSTATLADASVVATESPARSRLDVGKERNPFQENTPESTGTSSGGGGGGNDTPSTPASGSGSGDSSATAPATSGGGGGGGSVDTGGGSTPATDDSPIPDPPVVGDKAWTLDVKFGKDGETKVLKAVLPGRALPSSADPVLIYLAAVGGGAGARFLVSSDARAQGDGKCKPSEKTCTTITLMKGDTAFFDVAKGDTTTQYELELLGVVKRVVEAEE